MYNRTSNKGHLSVQDKILTLIQILYVKLDFGLVHVRIKVQILSDV